MDGKFKIIYNRIGNYPGNGVLSGYMARHHVISYPFMQVYAVVAAWYCTVHNKKLINQYDAFFNARGVNWGAFQAVFNIPADENYVYLEMDANQPYAGIINWVCWAESNLFIGPAGCYRLDDPSQRVDKIPLSMDTRQKKLAEAVKEAWKMVANPAVTGAAGQLIEFSININKAG